MAETKNDNSLFVTLSGLPGSGKTTLARTLDSYSPADLDPSFNEYFMDMHTVPMRWLLSQHGYRGSNTIVDLQSYHKQARERNQGHEILDQLSKIKNNIIIIDSIHHIDDLRYMHRRFGAFTLGLNLPIDVAKQRYLNDIDDEKHYNSFIKEQEAPQSSDDWSLIRQQARNKAWSYAITEVDNPKNYNCVEESTVKINADQSIQDIALSALKHIRLYIADQLEENPRTPLEYRRFM